MVSLFCPLFRGPHLRFHFDVEPRVYAEQIFGHVYLPTPPPGGGFPKIFMIFSIFVVCFVFRMYISEALWGSYIASDILMMNPVNPASAAEEKKNKSGSWSDLTLKNCGKIRLSVGPCLVVGKDGFGKICRSCQVNE